jgi:hypothetical protein
MLWIILIGFLMVGISLTFSYLELLPFIDAVQYECANTRGIFSSLGLIFRLIGHTPKLLPTIIDLGAMLLFLKIFSLGTGFAGGLAGLFASNLLSVFIYSKTHKNKEKQYA